MRKALLEDDRLKEDLRKYAAAKDQAIAAVEGDALIDGSGNAPSNVLVAALGDDLFDPVFENAEDQVCDAADGVSRDASNKTSGASLKSSATDQPPVSLEQLIDHASVWRGVQPKGAGNNSSNTLSTGYPVLDQCLPGGGWPRASLTEILVPQPGCGELQLVLPALTKLSQTHADEARRWISWIAPPYVPYAPALATAGIDLSRMLLVHAKAGLDIMWSAEQALRSGTCAAVLVWAPKVSNQTLRRLQLAAEEGDSWGIVFRSLAARREASPAAVRLQLAFDERGKTLHLLKSRGGRPLRMAADFLTP